MSNIDLDASFGPATFDDVCGQLDVVSLKFFDTLSRLQKSRDQLHTCMKDGFLLMSKARYSMGNKWVRSDQYNDVMTANVKALTLVSEDNMGIMNTSYELLENAAVEMQVVDKKEPEKNKENTDGLRRRKLIDGKPGNVESDRTNESLLGGGDAGCLEDAEESIINELSSFRIDCSDGDKQVKKWKDPITWFGVLVPQPLRQSQSQFKDSLQFVVEIASLQGELVYLKNSFHELKLQKERLTMDDSTCE